jgi:hypothetical protein
MANIGIGDKRREGMASSIGMLAADRGFESVRLWWSVWRWPAALLAGVVLWLALVTIAGAATESGCRFEGVPPPASLAVHCP